jgi:hypothetical protein
MRTDPDFEAIERHARTLETIAAGHPADTPEHQALVAAAQALYFVKHTETEAKFRAWVAGWSKPPTALQVLHAKLIGIEDFPNELLDETLRDVERLMERLRHLRQ